MESLMMKEGLVKPIAGVITSRRDLLEGALELMESFFGRVDVRGDWRSFAHTDCCAEEMGPGLWSTFVSFEKLVPGESAAGFKLFNREIEYRFSSQGRRTINIDPGYIDLAKLVMISGKYGGHKVALAPNVYADMMLRYDDGWVAMPWAFPDFRDGSLFPLFSEMRRAYESQLL